MQNNEDFFSFDVININFPRIAFNSYTELINSLYEDGTLSVDQNLSAEERHLVKQREKDTHDQEIDSHFQNWGAAKNEGVYK